MLIFVEKFFCEVQSKPIDVHAYINRLFQYNKFTFQNGVLFVLKKGNE